MGIRFEVNESGRPYYVLDDPRWAMLGSWLATDIQASRSGALDALAMVNDVANGRSVREVFEGVIYDVDIRQALVRVCHNRSSDYSRDYALDDTRAAVERYWVFMRLLPVNPELLSIASSSTEVELLSWEHSRGRVHPCRGRLGLPPLGEPA